MKKSVAVIAVLAISGCETAEITTPPVTVIPNSPSTSVGIDVYAKARARGNPVPRFRGQDTVTVRTWGKGENGRTEFSGVPCSLDSGLYKAKFQSPANIVVPNYGPKSPALFIRCQTETQSGSVTVNVVNFTSQQRQAGAAGTGVLGAIVVGAINAAVTDPEKDEFKYHPITVNLKDKK